MSLLLTHCMAKCDRYFSSSAALGFALQRFLGIQTRLSRVFLCEQWVYRSWRRRGSLVSAIASSNLAWACDRKTIPVHPAVVAYLSGEIKGGGKSEEDRTFLLPYLDTVNRLQFIVLTAMGFIISVTLLSWAAKTVSSRNFVSNYKEFDRTILIERITKDVCRDENPFMLCISSCCHNSAVFLFPSSRLYWFTL